MTNKKINIGINGFGRIGRLVTRIILQKPELNLQLVLINDPFLKSDYMNYLLKYDSIHGKFKYHTEIKDDKLQIQHSSGPIQVNISNAMNADQIPWDKHNVDIVIDSSGVYKTTEQITKYLKNNMKAIITAPASDDTPTFVMGVNEKEMKNTMKVVSNASCTTNCLAPIVKILDEEYGIVEGFMSTIHSTTATQLTVDGPSKGGKDWRGGRAAAYNIIPSSTGAAKAVSLVYPKVKGKLTGMAFRVPTLDVSTVDLTVKLAKSTSLEEINKLMKNKSLHEYKHILGYTEDEVVSSDFIGDSRSSIYDASASMQLNNQFFKLISWYDNEYGYSNRVVDLAVHMASL